MIWMAFRAGGYETHGFQVLRLVQRFSIVSIQQDSLDNIMFLIQKFHDFIAEGLCEIARPVCQLR